MSSALSLFSPPSLPAPQADGGALATRLAGKYLERVTGHFVLPGREGVYADLPSELPDALTRALRARGVVAPLRPPARRLGRGAARRACRRRHADRVGQVAVLHAAGRRRRR